MDTKVGYTVICVFVSVVIVLTPFILLEKNKKDNSKIINKAIDLIKSNEAVKEIVGDNPYVKLSVKTVFKTQLGTNDMVIKVKGDKSKDYFRIKLMLNRNELSVREISRRVGFKTTDIIWPEELKTQSMCYLPSNVYDSIIMLIISLSFFVIAQSAKKEGRFFRMLYPKQLTYVSSLWVYREMMLGGLLFAGMFICCLLNVFTIF